MDGSGDDTDPSALSSSDPAYHYQDMWGGMDTAGAECGDCPGPPPEFLLPPPPRPPVLQPSDPMYCSDESPLPMETCDALPLIDASYHSSPSLQTSAVIVLCSVLLGLFVFIGVILVWKHKRRVGNFLPCKTSPQNNCDGAISGQGVNYEDLRDVMPRSTPHHHPGGHIVAPQIEMLDVKHPRPYFSANTIPLAGYPSAGYPPGTYPPDGYPPHPHPQVFLCPSPYRDLYNPVYEELSGGEDSDLSRPASHYSEDEFAEDELSIAGDRGVRGLDRREAPPPYCSRGVSRRWRSPLEPLPPIPQQEPPSSKRTRSMDRRQQQFHEGLLLDALLQLYPRGVGTVEHPRQPIPSIARRIEQCTPYESVPVLGHLATFRPPKQPASQDSAIGSDSSYGRAGRRDGRRLSGYSGDVAMS